MQDLDAVTLREGDAGPLRAAKSGAIVLDEDHAGLKAETSDEIWKRREVLEGAGLPIDLKCHEAMMAASQSFHTGSSPSRRRTLSTVRGDLSSEMENCPVAFSALSEGTIFPLTVR